MTISNVIPQILWDVVDGKLKELLSRQERTKGKNRSSSGKKQAGGSVWIRQFHYNVMKEDWVGGCMCSEQKNLFFEYVTSIGNSNSRCSAIHDDYIAIEFGDGSNIIANKNRRIRFDDDDPTAGASSSAFYSYDYQSDLVRERMLRMGVASPNGEHFHILGCSNSQVKNYTFLFRKSNHIENNNKFLRNILPELSQLEQKKGVAKRVKYAGLLFSGVSSFITMPEDVLVQQILTVATCQYDFADGPGIVSIKLAQEIQKQMNLKEIPSIVQIRYGGKVKSLVDGKAKDEAWLCKGVLLVDPTEQTKNILSFRKSMLKTKLSNHKETWQSTMGHKLGIVDYSQKRIGKMNKQLICLLSANIPEEDLMQIQDCHLNAVRGCWRDPFLLGYLLAMESKKHTTWERYQQLVRNEYTTTSDAAPQNNDKSHRLPTYYLSLCSRRTEFCNEFGKLQIPLGCSRTLFGAVFPEMFHNFLKEGQCLVFTERGILANTTVIVSRSPSYTPGDIRVLDAVSLPETIAVSSCNKQVSLLGQLRVNNNSEIKVSLLRQLRNCILFATDGERPEADKMSGGDMDGDQYLVIWDKRLTKYASRLQGEEPALYDDIPPLDGSATPKPKPVVKNNYNKNKEDWISYMASFDNSMLGIVDSAFYATAKEKGIKSPEAKKLNSIFSSLVDKNPESLKEFENLVGSIYLPRQSTSSNGSSVWEQMQRCHEECLRHIQKSNSMPDGNDYIVFKAQLLGGVKRFEEWNGNKAWSYHFNSLIEPDKLFCFIERLKTLNDQEKLRHYVYTDPFDKSTSSVCQPIDKEQQKIILPDEKFKEKSEVSSSGYENSKGNGSQEKNATLQDLNEKFIEIHQKWRSRSNDVFASEMAANDRARRKILDDLEHEQRRKKEALLRLDTLRENHLAIISKNEKEIELIECQKEVLQLKLECKESCELLHRYKQNMEHAKQQICNLDTAKESLAKKREMQVERLSIVEEAQANLEFNFFQLFGWDSKQNELTGKKKALHSDIRKVDERIKLVNEKRAEMAKQGDHWFRKSVTQQKSCNDKEKQLRLALDNERFQVCSDSHCMTVDALNKEIQHLETEIQQLEKVNIEIESERYDLLNGNLAQKMEIEETQAIEELEAATKQFKESKTAIQCEKNLLDAQLQKFKGQHKLQTSFEDFLSQNKQKIDLFFDSTMLSQSSYLSLKKIAMEFEVLDYSWWKQCLSCYFELPTITSQTQNKASRNENQRNLKDFFCAATSARRTIADKKDCREAEMKAELAVLEGEFDAVNISSRNLMTSEGVTRDSELSSTRELLTEPKQNVVVKKMQFKKRNIKKKMTDLKKRHEIFNSVCIQFEETARGCLNGELDGCIPYSLFLDLKAIVDGYDELAELKGEYERINKRAFEKAESIEDPELFFLLKSVISTTQEHYASESPVIMEQIIREMENKASSLVSEMARLEEQYDEYKDVCNTKLAKLKDKLSATFCPRRLEDLAKQMEDRNYEESVMVAQKGINRVLQNMCHQWREHISMKSTSREGLIKALNRLDKYFMRICDIEEDRLLGSLQNGKRNGRLPIYEKRSELQRALMNHDVVIVIAGTGCGKSTQLPQYILDDFYAHSQLSTKSKRDFARICCTQPRRMAAQKVAKRVAIEYKTEIGDMVGYRVGRKGSGSVAESQKISSNTRIEFVTEGWLLHHLTKSPNTIYNYDCIVVDEAHERNVETDLLLALLRQHLLQKNSYDRKNCSLKVVVMSATIDPGKFCSYFGNCPFISCLAKVYPVEEMFRPPVVDDSDDTEGAINISHAVDTFFEILNEFGKPSNFEGGDCLIFLSGSSQINQCVDRINARAKKESMLYVVAYPLYAHMPQEEKDAATNPDHRTGLDKVTDGNHKYSRKVICCTNIAETSLTIEKVKFVIEGGYAKKLSYDHVIRSKAVTEEKISQASAQQRKGRAGRTAPGRCYYLYSQETYESMKDFDTPQIMQKPVEELILYSFKVYEKSLEQLDLLDCPDMSNIKTAKELLLDLGMMHVVEDEERLTEDGKVACQLTMLEPQALRMILRSQEPDIDSFDSAIKLGAILSYDEDFFIKRTTSENEELCYHDLGDHFHALQLFEMFERQKARAKKGKDKKLRQWCKDHGVNFHAMTWIQSVVEQCYKEMKKHLIVKKMSDKDSLDANPPSRNQRLLRAMVSGYFVQIAECIDPMSPKKLGFSLLTPVLTSLGPNRTENREGLINLKLGRSSCLYHLLDEEDTGGDYISDDDAISDHEVLDNSGVEGGGDQTACFEQSSKTATFSFIIHGSLLSIRCRSGHRLDLIEDATVINDGQMIKDYAPEGWCNRVQFDPFKPSVSKRTIKHIGRTFLLNISNCRKELSGESLIVDILWAKSSIALYGRNADDVDAALNHLNYRIQVQRKKKVDEDAAKHFLDKMKIAIPQQAIIEFGCGLELKAVMQNSEPVQSLVDWFRGNAGGNYNGFIEPRHWHVRMDTKKSVITVFVNRGDATIFKDELEKIFSKDLFQFKVFKGKIEVASNVKNLHKKSRDNSERGTSKKKDKRNGATSDADLSCELKTISNLFIGNQTASQKAQCFSEYLNQKKHMLNPETVNIVALEKYCRQAKASAAHAQTSARRQLWKNIGKEWIQRNIFWRRFCKDTTEKFGSAKSPLVINYVPSRSHFEIFACHSLKTKVKNAILEDLMNMCTAKYSMEHHPHIVKYTRWKLCEVISTVGELQLRFSKVLFTIQFKTSVELDNDEENTHASFRIGSLSKTKTYYEYMDLLKKQGGQILDIFILLSSPKQKSCIRAAQKALEEELPSSLDQLIDLNGQSDNQNCSICCMCRRSVKENKYMYKKDDAMKSVEDKDLVGWRLTLCGCLFCRQCFLNAASAGLKLDGCLKCRRCSSPVLGSDCENICKPIIHNKATPEKSIFLVEQYQADWDRLGVLGASNYCRKIADACHGSASFECPDCTTSMHCTTRQPFARCRNSKCFNQFCCRCGQVPTSEHSFQSCKAGKCEKICEA